MCVCARVCVCMTENKRNIDGIVGKDLRRGLPTHNWTGTKAENSGGCDKCHTLVRVAERGLQRS